MIQMIVWAFQKQNLVCHAFRALNKLNIPWSHLRINPSRKTKSHVLTWRFSRN